MAEWYGYDFSFRSCSRKGNRSKANKKEIASVIELDVEKCLGQKKLSSIMVQFIKGVGSILFW